MVGISPVATTELDVCGAGAPVVGISPAQTVPENTQARTTANAKFLILSVSPFEDASLLARKQHSVNTYMAIDTASRVAATIRDASKSSYTHRQRFIFREDSLTQAQNCQSKRE